MAEHSVDSPDQQAIYDLMRAKLFEMFGPGGSFTISLNRASLDDAQFISTVADTVAWQVASELSEPRATPARRVAEPAVAQAEHEALWRHIESELDIRSTGPEIIAVDAQREAEAAATSRRALRAV
ncbi:MAG: hypothetical protein ACOH19_06815 [Rhodoglobus sp.]